MDFVQNCTYRKAQYLYVTNPVWSHAPRTRYSPHNLIFVTEGVMYIEQNGIRYEVREGQCIFLKKGYASTGYRPSGVNTGFYYVLFHCDDVTPDFPTFFTLQETKNVRELLFQLVNRLGYSDYPTEAMNSLMHALFYEVLYQSRPHTEPETSLAQSIKTYVYASIYRRITVNDIALHFNLCPDHISRVFYKSERVQLKKYITDLRIRRIEEYLSSATHTIQTTADVMGFQSSGALCKFYKYHTGLSPSEYRRRFYSEDSSGKV